MRRSSSQKNQVAGVAWRRLPRSPKSSPSGRAKRTSHSKCAAANRKRLPSTVPSVPTSSGSTSSPRATPPEPDCERKITPSSFIRISLPAR